MVFCCIIEIIVVPLQPQKWLLRWLYAINTLKKNGL